MLTRDGVIIKLKRRCHGTQQVAVAKAFNVSPAYLSDVMVGRRDPGPKILAGLGLERVVRYRPIK